MMRMNKMARQSINKLMIGVAAAMMSIPATSCFNVDDYVNYVEEEPPIPQLPIKPENPEIIPEQGGGNKPSGSGGVKPGQEDPNPIPGGGGEVIIPETLTISAISPAHGDARGGYEIRVLGKLLSKDGIIRFGNITSPLQTYVSNSVVRVIVPAGKPGCVDIVWTQDDGTLTIPNGFCYRENVEITEVDPRIVVAGQPVPITIKGKGFDEKTRAYFKNASTSLPLADRFVSDSETISGIFPPLEAGTTDLVITNAISGVTVQRAIQVLPALDIKQISPGAVETGHPQTINLKGSGFNSNLAIRIGSHVIAPQIESDTELSFEAPDLADGDYEILVYDSWRQMRSPIKLHYYTDDGEPHIFSASPSFGPTSGNTMVNVYGAHLPDSGNASFGSTDARIYTQSDSQWIIQTKPANAGIVDIVLDSLRSAGAFEFIDYPSLITITPNHGVFKDQTTVTLTGDHFSPDLRVKFGPWESGQVKYISDTKAEALVPPGSGEVAITLIQQKAEVSTDLIYTYDDPVEITGIAPEQSSITGNLPVYLYGSGFNDRMTLLIDGIETKYHIISGNMLFFDSPEHEEGNARIELKCEDGKVCANSQLTYFDPSGINSSASGGVINGQIHVTVLTVNTSEPIPGATVYVGSNKETALRGITDANGRVSFYDSSLKDDQIVVACAPEHSCNTLQPLNASNITLFLEDWHADDVDPGGIETPPPPPPQPSDFDVNPVDITIPYTPKPSYFTGKVHSFGKVELASDPDVVKAGIVMQSTLGTYAANYENGDIYYLFNEGSSYKIRARRGEVAIALVCGLHNIKTGDFTPKYIGMVRHIMVTDGMEIVNDLSCTIPLNQTQPIKLIDAPLKSGPNIVISNSYISLGNEGYIGGFLMSHSYTDLVVATNLPQLSGVLEDATISHVVGAYSSGLSNTGQIRYYYPATVFYSYDNPISQTILDVGPAAPIPRFLTDSSEDILSTGTIAWTVEYPQNVDFYQITVTMYSSAGQRLLYQFYLPGSATSAEFPTYHKWPADHSGQLYIQITAYKSIRNGFDFNRFSTAELRYNYIHSSASETLSIQQQ